MSSTEFLKSIKYNNAGPLDAWWGPYESAEDVCAAIPNNWVEIDGTLVNMREGKCAGIITADGIVEHWWPSDFSDEGLVPKVNSQYVDEITQALDERVTTAQATADVAQEDIETIETVLLPEKANKVDIVNNLTAGGSDKILSAEQGKNLKAITDGLTSDKANKSDIVDNLTTGGSSKILSAEQGKILQTNKADELNVNGKVQRGQQVSTYTTSVPVIQFADGYYIWNTGVKTTGAARKTRLFPVVVGKDYKATALISGNSTALAVYFSGTPEALVYISNEFRGPSSGSTQYTRQTLTIPAGTTYVGICAVTPFPLLEDLVVSYPKTVYEIDDPAGGKVMRTPLEPSYIIQTPTQEFTNGFYSTSPTSPIPNTGSPRKSRLFAVDESKSYLLTATTLTTSLAVYYDVNMVVLGSQYPSGEGYTTRNRVPLTLPANTKFVGSSAGASMPFPVLEEVAMIYRNDYAYRGNSNKTNEQLDIEKAPEMDATGQKVLRQGPTKVYTEVIPVSTATGGFYSSTTGAYSTGASRNTNVFPISDIKNYAISGNVSGTTYLVLYYKGTPTNLPLTDGLTFLGVRQFNSAAAPYVRQILTVPADATYISCNSATGAVLEQLDFLYRNDVMFLGGEEGFNTTGKQLYDMILDASLTGPKIDRLMVIGDSKLRFDESYIWILAEMLSVTSLHNLAQPGARMSKTSQFSPDYPVAPTQNYDDPEWLGVTTTSPNTSMTVDQLKKCANNWAGYQVQRAIHEVTTGLFEAPEVILFDVGTNADYKNGSPDVNYGTIEAALNGKTMDRDNTFNFANAFSYCIRELKKAFPDALIITRTIVQRAEQAYNTSFLIPKNILIKGIASGLATYNYDAFSLSGVSEKNEIEGGNGQDLKDGVHYNYHGGEKEARNMYALIKSLYVKI